MTRWLIEKAGVQITVETTSNLANQQKAQSLVEIALKAMRAQKVNKTQGFKVSVKYQDQAWVLCDHANDVTRKLTQPGDLIYHLTDRIVFHIADQAKDKHCLHAAAVAKNGNAAVIPASSGAGKSTFTTWLVANNFDYLTDELILIDAARQIEGVARPIQIKSHGLAAVQPLVAKSELVQAGKFASALPIDCLNGHTSELDQQKLALFIFPRYRAGASYAFTKLSSAQAGMSLMSNHVNARNLDGHGFREMMAVMRQTPAYSLEYGGFDTLPANFSAQLEDLLAAV